MSEIVERDRIHWVQYPIMSARMNANKLAHGTPSEERFILTPKFDHTLDTPAHTCVRSKVSASDMHALET
jgi:hypothetical protein